MAYIETFDVPEHLDPVALQIGRITLEWNNLHEKLAVLFWMAISPGAPKLAYAMWNCLTSDRVQRDVLRSAVSGGAFANRVDFKRISRDVGWLLDQVNKLSDQRNDVIHGPITALADVETGQISVWPNAFTGNRRAGKLGSGDLAKNFSDLRMKVATLTNYAVELGRYPPESEYWPTRPSVSIKSKV